ncbi:uncharacterized protein LOC130508709 [Raphanus sativus]|uniref:Uncharacterized protein LOC108857881 n=1 Tax=Raphanus sativus TaxID=3726 RepID=A0A9W3CLS3_RAPSA|nr:uncharacterized protein LOC108857881 [Raphanus sativus]XP_056860332.1 uncharacterized protein LOC130508709 [Raphanus sativus]
MEEEFWRQRSRQLWLTLGDANTGYFHAITKGRKTRNRLSVMENEAGTPSFEEDQISAVICDFYEKLFDSPGYVVSSAVNEALKPCISTEQNELLIKEPTPEEIKRATFAIHADKAPGPDGFSASFFHSNWQVVGPAVVAEVQQFFLTGELSTTINNTHVRLIPKNAEAKKVADFRPIALCNVLYKIISKVLALRLKSVLGLIISENQSAFVAGRAITDNILITHEVLQYLKTSTAEKNCTMAVKTDMSKAYDRLEWGFIAQVLQRLGIHAKCVQWIIQCVSTVTYSYLVNETVQGSVIPRRGIRQGDPLSPYLFILCSEVLSGLCSNAARDGTLKGIRVARGSPRVNHLLFADDTMFFCYATPTSCETLRTILKTYETASGQQINNAKSSITFSCKTSKEIKQEAQKILNITREGGSGKYLGLPEHFGRRKRDLFTSVVDRIRQKAVSWSTRFLSKAGKLTMLQSVLTAIPSHTMSCFEIPVSLCKRIQSVLTRFWWDDTEGTRKMSWVAWDTITKPKSEGGLGVRDIQIFNQALLAKQAWRILTKPDCLLARVLRGKYCHSKSFLEVSLPASCSHGWRSILHGRDLLITHLGKSIGNGLETKVWKDSWISLDEQIKMHGPLQEEVIDLRVADLLTTDLQWNKTRVQEILPSVAPQILCLKPSQTGASDAFIWQKTSSGTYTTKSGYYSARMDHVQQEAMINSDFDWKKDVWKNTCSPKLKVFLWSILKGALPLGDNLQRRGINTEVKCPRCQGEETTIHTFFLCPFAVEVWKLIPLRDVVHIATDEAIPEVLTKFRNSICLPPSGITNNILPWVVWSIWLSRNALIFEALTSPPEEIATRAIRLGREWTYAQGIKATPTNVIQRGTNSKSHPVETEGETLCRSDAAWNKQTKQAGFGWIFTGHGFTTAVEGSNSQDYVDSPLVAEAMAMRLALIKAATLEIKTLRMSSDNRTLIRAIHGDMQAKEIRGIVHDILEISSVFVSISFSFVSRDFNKEADASAKLSLRRRSVSTLNG